LRSPAVADLAGLAYVGFGSNLGDGLDTFQAAFDGIRRAGWTVRRISDLYASEPWGGAEGGLFTNAVLELEQRQDAFACLHMLLTVEAELGRIRERPLAARSCDLDLLLWGSESIHTPDLIVPHPRLTLRNFVLRPLCDLIADASHPAYHRTFSDLLAVCPDTLNVWPIQPKNIPPLT
jgi:2-amino-4-hydroxy-6-hydroxymethyldihydropteridine diphosphokinase